MEVIQLKNVTFTYPDAEQPALKNLSLSVKKGQFVVLCGPSGCGKSTLLRLLKKEIQPHGELQGEVVVSDATNDGLGDFGVSDTQPHQNHDVGFVFQDPENQVVADDFLHELVFGLENVGLSTNEMRSRVAEMVGFFGAESIIHRKTHELSGGKKQQMNLASVLLMQPSILLLDEPTAQLDPVSARELLNMLVLLNEEFGMTIILAEHRLEEVFTVADRIVMMEEGQIIQNGKPREVISAIWNSPQSVYIPSIPSLFLSVSQSEIPLSVKEGRLLLDQIHVQGEYQPKNIVSHGREILKVSNVHYRYEKDREFIIKGMDFSLKKGEIFALLGGNGAGKSTFLKLLCGIYSPERGKIALHEKALKAYRKNELPAVIGYLPQNPKLFFLEDTVGKEITATVKQWGVMNEADVDALVKKLGIAHLLNKHPYDLSGGELQKAALACVLIRKPELLLLDEPTKGLDPVSKRNLAEVLGELRNNGITILLSTHDVEFAAQYATRCGMIFQRKMTSEAVPREFFKGNFFYTTMIQRLLRGVTNNPIVTLEEAIAACEKRA